MKKNTEAFKPKPLFTNSLGDEFFAGETVYWWCSPPNSRVIKGNIDKIKTYEETGHFVHVSQIYKTKLQAKEDFLAHECPSYKSLINNGIIKLT